MSNSTIRHRTRDPCLGILLLFFFLFFFFYPFISARGKFMRTGKKRNFICVCMRRRVRARTTRVSLSLFLRTYPAAVYVNTFRQIATGFPRLDRVTRPNKFVENVFRAVAARSPRTCIFDTPATCVSRQRGNVSPESRRFNTFAGRAAESRIATPISESVRPYLTRRRK